MPILLKTFLACLCTVFCGGTYSAVRVASNSIPGLLDESNPNSPYNQVLFQLNTATTQSLIIDYFPPERAGKVFDSFQTDCIFPATSANMTLDTPLLQSDPINTAETYLFSTQIIADDIDLLNTPVRYTVAYRRGNSFGGLIENLSHHTLFAINSDAQLFGLLEKGRADFVLAYLSDVKHIIDDDITVKVYSSHLPVYSQSDSFVCHESDKTRVFISEINAGIETLRNNGELEHILEAILN